ncbi:MAG: hypothetical protein GY811_19560 [Myxococcales bacterium]|nr:hypothetical protein [Myxococcales bacterium]
MPEARNRLATFNDERSSIVDEVSSRIVNDHLRLAQDSPDESLEYVLNEVAFAEIQRLQKSSSKNDKKRLARWHDLAHRLGQMSEFDKRKELESIVRYHAQDIAGNFNPKVFRFTTDILPPALSFLLNPISGFGEGMQALGAMADQIRIEGPIDQIHRCCERGTLVVTPTHSSNLDSIVLGFALNRVGLPPVTYGAGKNLFSNAFMSYFMENLGAYRVDRRMRFGLYKEVLKEYSSVLLERGYHSLFFPGGTRSRSNKVENRLKLGLLGTTVSAMVNRAKQEGEGIPRIYVVPVTINYRLVLEAETLVEDYLEETGKSRYIIEDDEFSRIGRIVEFARKTIAHEGAAVVRFGAPLDTFGNAIDDDGESLDNRGHIVDPRGYLRDSAGEIRSDAQRDAVYTRILGRKLSAAFHRETVLMGTHIVAQACLEVAHKRTGIGDILRLMRLSESALALPVDDLSDAVGQLRDAILEQPEHGTLDATLRSMTPREIVDQTIHFMSTYHTKRVLYQSGAHIRVGSMKLLYYYRNRCAHVRFNLRSSQEAS